MNQIVLGLSGGVDSSVTAALLKKQGYRVTGVILKVWWEDGDKAFAPLMDDARRVAEFLNIELVVLDKSEQFRRQVVDYFAGEYLAGRTPNPCVMCNPAVKFKALREVADRIGAQYLATGHYAHIKEDPDTRRFILKRSMAQKKDQTYFLYSLGQDILSRTLMPLGDYQKPQVRALAEQLKIPVAQKPDSQEICFLPDNDYGDFLVRYTQKTPEPGDFIDAQGNVLGRHKGIIHYTIGQRKGLGCTFGKPMFVIGIDAENNTVTLGEQGSEMGKSLQVGNANFIPFEKLTAPMRVTAKVRQAAADTPATITPLDNGLIGVEFDMPVRAITKGQSAVFYDGDVVVGGGRIV